MSEEDRTEHTTDLRGALPPNVPRLQAFWDGGAVTRALPDAGTLTIGRSTSCDVRLDHPSVSRKHAILHLGPVPRIEDAGSQNGTRVGGRSASAGAPLAIAPGEIVEIGQVVVVLHRGEALPSHPAPMSSGAPGSSGAYASIGAPSSTGAFMASGPPSSSGAPSAAFGTTTMAPPSVRASETAMERVERLVRLVAASTIHVLVTGETGAGKKVIGERIHRASRRAERPLVRVDAASATEPLLDRELFGEGDVPGLFEKADGGTVLLDDVAELPPSIQAKLVRLLERGEVQRVGTVASRKLDVRFIASTSRNVRALVKEGAFREDLFFRLNGITIDIPPLRERPRDIEPLARELLAKACSEAGRPLLALGPEAVRRLESYDWPGNVRELENVIARAVLLSTGDDLDPEALPAGESVGDAAAGAALRKDLAAFERQRIAEALEKCAGNQTKAAALLGISRRTLVSRLGEYNLPRPRGGGGGK